MNILVTGASGFIAAEIVSKLLSEGHTITCCVRNVDYTKNLFPKAKVIGCDFEKDIHESVWLKRLDEIDIVINAVGIFYHPQKKMIWKIHYETPIALFKACVANKIKKIIQISALNVDKVNIDYAISKKAADDFLESLPISAYVIRPSLVYGRGSYGGTSLFRGMAALPYFIPIPHDGKQSFQPIHLDDLCQAISNLIKSPPKEKYMVLNAVSQKKINLTYLLTKLRSWLGLSKARIIYIPSWMVRTATWIGNLFPYSVINQTAYAMLIQNSVTTPAETKKFMTYCKITPRDYEEGIFSQPSTSEDRSQAKIYFLQPLLKLSIAFIWIFSALCSAFFYSRSSSYQLLASIGVTESWQPILLYGACIWNAFLGLGMLSGKHIKKIYFLQIITILIYTGIITLKLPHLWIEPFGAIAKNIPLLVVILFLLAMENDR